MEKITIEFYYPCRGELPCRGERVLCYDLAYRSWELYHYTVDGFESIFSGHYKRIKTIRILAWARLPNTKNSFYETANDYPLNHWQNLDDVLIIKEKNE